MTEQKKREFLPEDTQVVKGIAIILLCYYHLFHEWNITEQFQVLFFIPRYYSEMLVGFGNICVAVFLFLSAYGITARLGQKEESLFLQYKYSLRRCITLIINFVVMYISVNLVWFTKFDYALTYGEGKQGVLFLLVDALGLSHFFNTPTLNETWWYMELAIVCIFLVPLIGKAYRSIKYFVLPIALILPSIITMDPDLLRYYLVIVLGVVTAKEKWPERIHDSKIPKWVRIIGALLLLIGSIYLRQNYKVYETFSYIVDAPIALLLTYFIYEIIPGTSILGKIIGYLGKHSMNIYFVHTFFYLILYRSYFYKPKYAILILLLLVAVSLAYSVLLEFLKKVFRLPKLISLIGDRIENTDNESV